jgi:hypothetical protein
MVTRFVPAVVLGLALSACGSTVPLTSTTLLPGDGLSPSQQHGPGGMTSGTTGSSSTGSVPGLGSTGASTGAGTGLGTGTAGSAASTAAPLASQAETGLGVTATTINVGVGYATDGDALNAALGASGITTGDERANAQALIDEINAHGGIAGRKLVPVYYGYHVTSTDTGSTQDAAACQQWTVDHRVLAVFSSNLTDTLPACLKKAGVVWFKGGVIVDVDATYLRQYSNEFLLSTMSIDRIFKDQVAALVRQSYFTGWNTVTGAPASTTAKLGVITFDTDSFNRGLRRVLLPQLSQAGHPVDPVDVIEVHRPEQESDAAGTAAQIKSATLRLQQDGVTHVVLGDAGGYILEVFGSNARSQGYYPRLGVTSGAGVQVLHDAGLVTDKQVRGLAGDGWLPTLDLLASDGGRYATSETRRCLDIMKRRTGQTYTSTNAATIALADCDGMFLFTQAMRHTTALTPAGLIGALDAIGSSFVSPLVPKAFVSPRQHDTAIRAWDLNWVQSCTCVRYSSPRDVPSA